MTEIESLGDLVTRILDIIDAGPQEGGFEEPIRRGSASGSVAVVADPHDPGCRLLRVSLTIMRVPPDRAEEFYGQILGLNHGFMGRAAFSVNAAGVVFLTAARPVVDLDPGEVIDLILWTAEQADHIDDILLTEYGYDNAL